MINSTIYKKHYMHSGGALHIYDLNGDGRWNVRIKGNDKKIFKRCMRRRYKNLKLESEDMVEDIIKTDEELDNEYYDWYCNKVHTQPQELSEEEEYAYQKWYDENELSLKKLKDSGYSERAIMKKVFIFGLTISK